MKNFGLRCRFKNRHSTKNYYINFEITVYIRDNTAKLHNVINNSINPLMPTAAIWVQLYNKASCARPS